VIEGPVNRYKDT